MTSGFHMYICPHSHVHTHTSTKLFIHHTHAPKDRREVKKMSVWGGVTVTYCVTPQFTLPSN